MRSITVGAALLMFITVSLASFGRESFADAVSKAPHGGIVRQVEGMYIEFVVDKLGTPKLYLYDKEMKRLERTDLEVKVVVQGHDWQQHTRGLMASKDPKEGGVLYIGEPIRGSSDWDTAVVSIKVKNLWHHIRFSHR